METQCFVLSFVLRGNKSYAQRLSCLSTGSLWELQFRKPIAYRIISFNKQNKEILQTNDKLIILLFRAKGGKEIKFKFSMRCNFLNK